MEAILSKHCNQVETIKDNKRRIMNLDLTEIPTNHNQQDNDIKSQTQPAFYACDICEFTSNDLNSLNVHLKVHNNAADDDDIQEVIYVKDEKNEETLMIKEEVPDVPIEVPYSHI